MEHARARANRLPGILAAAGGVVVLIASFLPWFRMDFGQLATTTATANATDVSLGVAAIAGGVVLVAAGVFFVIGTASGSALVNVLLVTGLITVAVAVYNLATKDQQVDAELRGLIEQSTGQEATDEQVALLEQQLDELGVETSFQIGIYLTILGGLAGMAGGLLALSAGEARPAQSDSGFGPKTYSPRDASGTTGFASPFPASAPPASPAEPFPGATTGPEPPPAPPPRPGDERPT